VTDERCSAEECTLGASCDVRLVRNGVGQDWRPLCFGHADQARAAVDDSENRDMWRIEISVREGMA
jgi:hypothetical protein